MSQWSLYQIPPRGVAIRYWRSGRFADRYKSSLQPSQKTECRAPSFIGENVHTRPKDRALPVVILSRRQRSNGRKPCKRSQQTCKLHGVYDDSTLRQRNHAANDMTSSQLASHTIFTFVNVTLVVAGFVKRGNRRTVQDIPGCHRP